MNEFIENILNTKFKLKTQLLPFVVGLTAHGSNRVIEKTIHARDLEHAKLVANEMFNESHFILDVNPAPLTPETPNWENSPEAFLCRD